MFKVLLDTVLQPEVSEGMTVFCPLTIKFVPDSDRHRRIGPVTRWFASGSKAYGSLTRYGYVCALCTGFCSSPRQEGDITIWKENPDPHFAEMTP